MTLQSQIIELLTASLLRPVILAAAAWLILSIYKVRHPASRHAVWTAVLIGMMVLPFINVVAPRWKLPLLPNKPEPVTQIHQSGNFIDEESPDLNAAASTPSQATKPAWPASPTLIVWCYFTGVCAMAIFRLTGWALLGRVISKSRRLRTRLLESSEVITPVTVGVLRPSVILPAGWRDWNAKTRQAVLSHEFAHIRRRDTLTSSLTRLAKCIYWFHPLAWWISRQVSELAELSCDAAALEKNGDPGSYSKILLGFAETVNAAGYRTALPGLAIASRSSMGHRIDQVFELAGGNLRRLSRPGTVLALLGLPVLCLAAVVGLTAPATRALRQAAAAIIPPQPLLIAQLQRPTAAPPKPAQPIPAAPKPKFDVVSVRRCTPEDETNGPPGGRGGGGGRGPRLSPGKLRMQCLAVSNMIQFAYIATNPLLNRSAGPLDNSSISGGPGWVFNDWYTVDAETDDPVANGPTGPESRDAENAMTKMLQAVLEDRFQLKIHRAGEEVPMYDLTVAKGGLKLKPMEEGGCIPHVPGSPAMTSEMFPPGKTPLCITWGHTNGPDWVIDAAGQRLSNLAGSLSGLLDRHVLDKTGLSDLFSYHLEFAHDETTPGPARIVFPPSDIPPGPSIVTVLDRLGLKLEQTKGPQEHIVIDRIERPSEN